MTKFNKQILRQAFPDAASDGAIFTNFGSGMPWSLVIGDYSVLLDNMYFAGHSGDKFCSNIVYQFMDNKGEITTLGKQAIAMMLRRRFIYKWQHLWDAYTAEYPIDRDWFTHEEYIEDDDISYGKKRDLTTLDSSTDKESVTASEIHDDSRTTESKEEADETRLDDLQENDVSQTNVFGYNTTSATGVPNDRETTTKTNTGTQNTSGTTFNDETELNSGVSQNESVRTYESGKTKTDEENYSGTDMRDKGGIRDSYGLRAHSMQELIESEKTLWMWDYFRDVFNDIDSIICLKIYEPSFIRREYEYKEW